MSVTFWARQDGQLTEVDTPAGRETFAPHDCSLTRGQCTYVQTRPDGARRKMIRQSNVDGGTWNYQVFHTRVSKETRVEYGQFTVDAFGVNIDRDYVTGDGTRRFSRRIR